MSFDLQSKVWPLPAATVSQAAKLVLLRLSFFARDDGTRIWRSIPDLAADCSMSERTAQRAVQELLSAGILVKVRDADFARKQTCEYRIDVDVLDRLATPEKPADGCQIVTGVKLSPVTNCRSTGVKLSPVPVSNCHPSTLKENTHKEPKEDTQANKPAEVETDLLGNVVLPDRDECAEAVKLWNEMADRAGLSKVANLHDQRRRALRQRLHECGGLEGWLIALEKVEESDFLRGGGARGWKANFDFVMKVANFTKLMEGGYPGRQPAPGSGRQRKPWEIAPEAERRAGIIEGARRAARGNFGDRPSMRDAVEDFLAGFEDEDFR